MHCPRCKGLDVRRSLRRGILDALMKAAGFWPYRCAGCLRRFHRRRRNGDPSTGSRVRKTEAPANERAGSKDGPVAMAFRRQTNQPVAKIVLATETHEQLNSILLALHRAVMAYESTNTCDGARQGSM